MARILIVEDEIDLCNLLRSALEAEGHTVFQAFDGPSALMVVEKQQLQLIILDWMLPGLDGLSVCRRIRQNYLVPIIMLTARNEEVDLILGLEVGADDYMSKPFSIRELRARVQAILRRVELDSHKQTVSSLQQETSSAKAPNALAVQVPSLPTSAPIVYGSLCILQTEHTILLNDVELDLTPKEYELLVLLVSHPGRAFSRDFLLQRLWSHDYDGYDRTVDTHITRLRKKLGKLGEKIVPVWGVGYRFTP